MGKEFYIILKNTWSSSIPLIFAGLIAALMSLIDGFFLSHYDQNSFKALILVIPVVSLVAAMSTGIGVAFADSLLKNKNTSEKIKTLIAAFLWSLLTNVLTTIICICLFENFIEFNNLNNNSIFETNALENNVFKYWFWIIPTYWFQTMMNIILQYLAIKNHQKKANFLLVIITISNFILNPILIFYFDLGIKGAAIATCISFAIGVFYFFFQNENTIRKIFKNTCDWLIVNSLKVIIEPLKRQGINIISVFAAIGIFSVGQLFFNQFAVELGTEALILFGISEQLKMIVTIPTRGVTGAYLIQFGIALKSKSVNQYFNTYLAATFIIGVIYLLGCVFVLFFPTFISDFYNLTELKMVDSLSDFLKGLAIIFLIAILPRASQVAFINLEKGYLLFLQSFLLVFSSLLFIKILLPKSGAYSLIEGQILGISLTFIVFLPIFYKLLKNKIKEDKK